MKKKKKQTNSKLQKFSLLLWVISIIFMILLGYLIYKANVLPLKYFLIIVIFFVLLMSIHGIFVLKKKTKTAVLIFLNLITLIFMSCEALAIVKINETLAFLKANLGARYETNIYYVLSNKDATYESINDIAGMTIYSYKDLDDMSKVESELTKKVNASIEYKDNIVDLLNNILEDTKLVILVNSGNYDAMAQNDENYEKRVKIIDTIDVQTEIITTDTGINVTKDPFVLYLSGIDTRSGKLPSRSLSDVNIVVAVNPKDKKILMVHIPRDYYVQVHGTTGLKDKLTHTGTIGGVDLTMQTIEDLLEIKIPYYARVNFNSVVNLVDAIGGITLNSDVDYSFSCWTDRSCTFNPGLNTVDGKCALAFARERHAYSTGDRHRGENQEQVIEKVINKVTSSSTIISNYSEILNALNGTFETNLATEEITSLVKMQLNDMASWHISSYNVDGTGGLQPTYSYPNQNLYVMNPNMETVSAAVQKLNEVLDEN